MTDFRRGAREKMPVRHGEITCWSLCPTWRARARSVPPSVPTALEAVVVRDGDEAKQLLARRGTPTLLILDLSLPKVDGFELLRELRQHTPAGEAGAIVVSGHSAIRAAARRLAEPLGIARVLSIDVDRAALREAIDATLGELTSARPAAETPAAAQNSHAATGSAIDELIDAAVIATSRRFRTAITIAYVKIGPHEHIRGFFALSDPNGTVNTPQGLALLRQVAGASDSLIVPNVVNYPALHEIAPGGMALVRGLAATPLGSHPEISGALCVMDVKALQMDATELDALEALAQGLHRDLCGHEALAEVVEAPAAASPVDIDNLERLASADPLTGLANRRGGEKDIAAEISRARRQSTALSCVLLDIDHFKEVNDTFGHQAGDYVLREISALLRRTVRAYDILVRWGGEEFLAVLPGVGHEQALKLAERIRHAVETMPLAGIGNITASVGVAALASDYSFEGMFANADRKLYSAKASGRNTVA